MKFMLLSSFIVADKQPGLSFYRYFNEIVEIFILIYWLIYIIQSM